MAEARLTDDPQRRMSVGEYLAFEETSDVRHEYVGGILHAQAGASDRHNRLAGKIYRTLAEVAEGGPCRVYMSDMRLMTASDVFYYPDVMVCCEPPDSENPTFRTDPCLVVEVTSPGTAQVDRREKLSAYCELPTLKAYLIADQNEQRIEHHFRDESGEWWQVEHTKDREIEVPCPPGVHLALPELYRYL